MKGEFDRFRALDEESGWVREEDSPGTADEPEEPRAQEADAPPPSPPSPAAPPATVTPEDTVPPPEPGPDGRHDLDASALYLNRELTWLNFNFRVLHEAEDPRTPLLERVKFLAIVASNLDEFFMKRIGGLKQQVGARVTDLTVDGRTPEQQIEECYAVVRVLLGRKRAAFRSLQPLLAAEGIEILTYSELPDEERREVREHYFENIYPLVTPQATDPAHPFPFVSNLSLNLLVTLSHPGDSTEHLARVKVPVGVGVPRFIALRDGRRHVPLESVMAHNLDLLFPGMEVEACETFRVTRNANTEHEEETAEDLVEMIESELRERKLAPIVRLEVAAGIDPVHRGMLAAELGLDEQADVFEVEGILGMQGLHALAELEAPELHEPPHHPADHPALTTDRSIFHTVRERGAILLHHPYQSFNTSVERLLEEASRDPKVRAIKMTFYRTSEDSRAIEFLMDAARNGKQVAVVMELKARFDEEANLRWSNRLGSVGIHVTYGVVGLKTHCKLILVVRQDYDGLRRYTHMSTGNYHAGTARLYSDLGLMSADPEMGQDLTELFNYLTTGYKPKRRYRKILVAPKGLKKALLQRIKREIDHQRGGSEGLIQFKMNALEDADVTRALYEASMAGVRVDLIVRDSCRLRAGIPGLSGNVTVLSVVGRFLEHSRVYYFRNGGAEEYFIGSADCMRRNLQSRVEALAPVEHPDLQSELRFLLDAQLGDRRSAWEMRASGSYVQRAPIEDETEGCQQQLIARADAQAWEATRLRRRQVRGLQEGNLGSNP